ncbi:hypothetical protein [Curtobacterium sp. ME12]|nr:hypothetical protein [Curtobacterium sp. ME12]
MTRGQLRAAGLDFTEVREHRRTQILLGTALLTGIVSITATTAALLLLAA